MKWTLIFVLITSATILVGCASPGSTAGDDSSHQAPEEMADDEEPPEAELRDSTGETASDAESAEHIREILDGAHRSGDRAARDQYRNPLETLQFFGVTADATVVEIWPGPGWYTEILGPLLDERGTLRVGLYETKEGDPDHRPTQVTEQYLEMVDEQRDVLGEFEMGTFAPPEIVELGELESAQIVLSIRNLHLLHRDRVLSDAAQAYYEVLKPGGTLGIVQHRAPEGSDPDEMAEEGYLPEQFVVDHFEEAGFVLEERSEINANPEDTADHEHGVWSLPPVLTGDPEDAEHYTAIGESDRMTLRFVKPNDE